MQRASRLYRRIVLLLRRGVVSLFGAWNAACGGGVLARESCVLHVAAEADPGPGPLVGTILLFPCCVVLLNLDAHQDDGRTVGRAPLASWQKRPRVGSLGNEQGGGEESSL